MQIPAHHNGVLLLGEAAGENEAEESKPFCGKAGFKLTRLLEWAGFDRAHFLIANTCLCRPPNNRLEGESYEIQSISHCKTAHWGRILREAKVVVPLGNVPTNSLLGQKGILGIRGYIFAGTGYHIIPTVHPSFIARGQSKWSAPFIQDVQKAVSLAQHGMPPQITSYLLDPSPMSAYKWAQDYKSYLRDRAVKIAFDIETPGKEDEDELDLDSDAPDRTWNIERISFAYKPLEALSIPWAPEYFAAIKLILESDGEKVVWNAGFDVPRIRRAGISIHGLIHDGMVAWHILHSDLPKSLRFVATFTCPWQPAWKHLSGSKPAFYNATDSDVEWRSMDAIQRELERTGLWDVYRRDVLELEPILLHMHEKGMPVDEQIRLDRALKLDTKLKQVTIDLEKAVPVEARRIDRVYKNEPKEKAGLASRKATRVILTCAQCGLSKPRKDHTKRFKKKLNPCADARIEKRAQIVDEYYRLAKFAPSGQQLGQYHKLIGRGLPTVFDKRTRGRRVSFGERQILDLAQKYPDDSVYKLILEFRQLQKIQGTYIGRIVCEE